MSNSSSAVVDLFAPSCSSPVPEEVAADVQGSARWVRERAVTWSLFAVPGVFLIPALVWILLDQSVWPWDSANYGEGSVHLYAELIHGPSSWLHAMKGVSPNRAPGTVWFGQFFVPLGQLIGSIDVGLLLSILVCQWLTLVLMANMGRKLFPDLGPLGAWTACFVVASSPLFMGRSHWYMTEPLQLLGVAWMFHTAAFCKEWSRWSTVSHLIGAGCIVLLGKATAPAYCLAPGFLVVARLLSREDSMPALRRGRRLGEGLGLLASLLLLAATFTWYRTNWREVYEFVQSNSTGMLSHFYGHPGTLAAKFVAWLEILRDGLFISVTFWSTGAACAIGLGVAVARRRRSERTIDSSRNRLVAAAFVQVVLYFGLASRMNSQEPRFILPLIPAVAIISAWGLAQIGSRRLTQAFALAFVVQWGYVTTSVFRIPCPPNPSTTGFGIHAPMTDTAWKDEASQLVALLMSDVETARHPQVVGVEDWRLNPSGLCYLAAKERLRTGLGLSFACLDYPFSNDPDKAWKRLEDLKVGHFLTLAKSAMIVDRLNVVAPRIADRVAEDPRYRPVDFPSSIGVLVYRRACVD
jgi:hypothetical protein